MSATNKAVALFVLVLFTFSTPGCLEDLVDEVELYQGETSTVTMEIIHGESVANATATYTIEIELYHDAAPNHTDNLVITLTSRAKSVYLASVLSEHAQSMLNKAIMIT